jgi:hypothetical protein
MIVPPKHVRHWAELVRTVCSVFALIANLTVLVVVLHG